MKKSWIILAGMLLTACDYDVALVGAPDINIDEALIGSWSGVDKDEHLLVLPLGEREYLVSYPSGTPDAMFARGSVWRESGLTLVQLDWFGNAGGELNDAARYQYAAFTIEEDTLRVRLLNPRVVSTQITSSDALAKEIRVNREHPDLFRDEMAFVRDGE